MVLRAAVKDSNFLNLIIEKKKNLHCKHKSCIKILLETTLKYFQKNVVKYYKYLLVK